MFVRRKTPTRAPSGRPASTAGKRRLRRRRGPRPHLEGAAAVEFALVAPLFIMLVMGMLDYGYFFYVDLICSNAAREAARAGVVADTLGDSLPLAESQGYVVLSNAGLGRGGINQPDVSAAIDGARAIRVVVSGPFTPLVGFVPLPDTLQAAATMRYEGDL